MKRRLLRQRVIQMSFCRSRRISQSTDFVPADGRKWIAGFIQSDGTENVYAGQSDAV